MGILKRSHYAIYIQCSFGHYSLAEIRRPETSRMTSVLLTLPVNIHSLIAQATNAPDFSLNGTEAATEAQPYDVREVLKSKGYRAVKKLVSTLQGSAHLQYTV